MTENSTGLAVGNVDQDGYPDVVTANQLSSADEVALRLGNGDGTLGTAAILTMEASGLLTCCVSLDTPIP